MAKLSDKDAFLLQMRTNYDRAITADQEERDLALEDLNFKNGDQWDEAVKKERQAADRPCLTTNRLPGFSDLVTGQIMMNTIGIKVRPVDGDSDPETADIMGGIIRNIESISSANTIYNECVDSSVNCGRAFFRILTQYADDNSFDQEIVEENIPNQFSVTWDPSAKKSNLSDAAWMFISDEMTRDAFNEKYPKAAPIEFPNDNSDLSEWTTRDMVKIAEYWIKRPKKKTIYQLEDGKTVEKVGKKDKVVNERIVDSYEIVWHKVSGNDILEGPQVWAGKYIPIVPVWGKITNIGNKRKMRGIIRFAKDPQRIYNYWRTAYTELISMMPKQPYILTEKQIEGHEDMWSVSHLKLQSHLLYTPDTLAPGRPVRETPPQMSSGISDQLEFSVDELKATTGIYEASLGQRSNEVSGIAIEKRQNQGNISTFHFQQNLSDALAYAGRILIDLIPKIYDTARVVRIIGDDDAEKFVMINSNIDPKTGEETDNIFNDLSLGKYDVVATTGPGYLTQREEAVEHMMDLIKVYPDIAPVIMDQVVKHLDFPGALEISDRLKKIVPPGIIEDDEDAEGQQQQQGMEQQPMPEKEQQLDPTMEVKLAQEQVKLEQEQAKLEIMKVEIKIKELEADNKLHEATSASTEPK